MTPPAMQTAEDMQRRLMDRAAVDATFRQQLVSDPRGAIRSELGVDVPEGIQIQVHENDSETLHLALPANELGEEQLEAIAAGRCCCCCA